MFLVRRFERNTQFAPDDERADDIAARLDAVGDQRTGVAEYPAAILTAASPALINIPVSGALDILGSWLSIIESLYKQG